MRKIKFTMIGAGSVCFCPATLGDILLNDSFRQTELEISLMDIREDALRVSEAFARKAIALLGRQDVTLNATTNLRKALEGADFVISAIEVERYYYWSMDFHIPRRYGFRQVYGENGGPGGMFHTLRNLGPTLDIAHAMEEICPDAYLLNYTNPEAKLVEGVSKRSREQLFGRTEQNKVVVFARGTARPGDFVKVRITGSTSATLLGERCTEEV